MVLFGSVTREAMTWRGSVQGWWELEVEDRGDFGTAFSSWQLSGALAFHGCCSR